MRVLVTGASGQLGAYLLRECARAKASVDLVGWTGSTEEVRDGVSLRPVDLSDRDRVAAAFHEASPSVVIHAGAMASVAECHRVPNRAWSVNVEGTVALAELSAAAGARLVFVSTDLAFDGERGNYAEVDLPSPLSTYGRTKAAAEQAVLAAPGAVVVRVSLLFGPSLVGRPLFFDEQLAALRDGRPIMLFEDEWRTPLAFSTAARALAAIAWSDFAGLLHVGGPERMSRLEMGRRLARHLGVGQPQIVASLRASVGSAEPRPRDTSLDSSRWRELFPDQPWPTCEVALREMLSDP